MWCRDFTPELPSNEMDFLQMKWTYYLLLGAWLTPLRQRTSALPRSEQILVGYRSWPLLVSLIHFVFAHAECGLRGPVLDNSLVDSFQSFERKLDSDFYYGFRLAPKMRSRS